MKVLTFSFDRSGPHRRVGPLYDPRTEILHFLDIAMKRLYHYNTGSSTLICDEFDEAITALALREDGEGVSSLPFCKYAYYYDASLHALQPLGSLLLKEKQV